MILSHLSVSRRILLVLLIGIATPAFVSVQSLIVFRNALLEARSSEVRHLDETAWAIVAAYHDRATKGLMSEQEAQGAAKEAVRSMHYDGSNYFFVWDLAGNGVVHGGNVALEGKNFIQGPDARNNPGIADMVEKLVRVARDHQEGFARYRIPKAGQTNPIDKIGYSKLFAPWGWAIGTGAYIEDIDAIFWFKARSDLITTGGLIALACLISTLLGRDLSRALRQLTLAMEGLARGDLATPIPAVKRRDEVGVMAGTVQVFKTSAVRTKQLEADKALEQKSAAEAAALVVSSIGMGLERLAAGDLTFRLHTALPHAYEKLRTDFNSAMGQLEHLVTGIVANTTALRSGTGEIAVAADDLSCRTEQQAASLESTAAALDAITATVQCTAESSGKARQIVSAACDDAERTGFVVREAVDAMEGIEKSSQEIGQIVAVIDEIAFQTNMLALNAAIEAEQAGYAGRGFTAVASEVRALAQRSADAAKAIKTLIGASTQQVTEGVRLVGETGQALGRIVNQVGSISATIANIATSAEEQANGLQQVNAAVNHMDSVTQRNAIMVEQSTAATHALMEETAKLATLTGRFRFGDLAAFPVQEFSARRLETVTPLKSIAAPKPPVSVLSSLQDSAVRRRPAS